MNEETETKDKYFGWVGEGVDCENCGWTGEGADLTVEQNGDWEFRTGYGCYGGSVFGTDYGTGDADGLNQALEELQHVKSFAENDLQDLDDIEQKLNELLEKETSV